MISGVRASSMRMLSTSSTIAKWWPALDVVRELELHVVAEVVEAELVVRAVGDVARRRRPAAPASFRSCWMTPTVMPRKR